MRLRRFVVVTLAGTALLSCGAQTDSQGSSGVDAQTCPANEPALGSPCAFPFAILCTYPDTCTARPPTASGFDHLHCDLGVWAAEKEDGYTPACPETKPVDGTSCMCGIHPFSICTYGTCATFGGPSNVDCASDTRGSTWKALGPEICDPPRDAGPDTSAPPDTAWDVSSEAGE